MIEKKMTKISPLTEEFIENKKTEGIIQDGYFIQEFPEHGVDRENRFSGLTYILTGPLSYSTKLFLSRRQVLSECLYRWRRIGAAIIEQW